MYECYACGVQWSQSVGTKCWCCKKRTGKSPKWRRVPLSTREVRA